MKLYIIQEQFKIWLKKYPGNCLKDFECARWRCLFCRLGVFYFLGKSVNATGTLEEDT